MAVAIMFFKKIPVVWCQVVKGLALVVLVSSVQLSKAYADVVDEDAWVEQGRAKAIEIAKLAAAAQRRADPKSKFVGYLDSIVLKLQVIKVHWRRSSQPEYNVCLAKTQRVFYIPENSQGGVAGDDIYMCQLALKTFIGKEAIGLPQTLIHETIHSLSVRDECDTTFLEMRTMELAGYKRSEIYVNGYMLGCQLASAEDILNPEFNACRST